MFIRSTSKIIGMLKPKPNVRILEPFTFPVRQTCLTRSLHRIDYPHLQSTTRTFSSEIKNNKKKHERFFVENKIKPSGVVNDVCKKLTKPATPHEASYASEQAAWCINTHNNSINMFAESTKVVSEHKEATQLLLVMKTQLIEGNYPPQCSIHSLVNLLLEVINGTKPAEEKLMRRAALEDFPSKGNLIVKALIKMGIPHTEEDIELIKHSNPEAAELLRQRPVASIPHGPRAY